MRFQRIRLIISVLLSTTLLAVISPVQAENIDTDDDGSQYAYGENIGWISLEPGGDGGPGVEVTDTGLSGYMWGENTGWINLSPPNGGVGNDGLGNLSGYAWGENIGWVSFAPAQGGVTIDPDTGEFAGYAWGENTGWISFHGTAPVAFKVTTAWRATLPALSINSTTAVEGDSGTTAAVFTVALSKPSSLPVTVNYATADFSASAAGGDYTAVSGTLTFAPGETSQTVTVTIAGDTIYEQHETFFLNLSNATNATLFNTQGIGTIVNDDSGSTPALSVDDVTVTEGNTGTVNATFTVNLSTISGNIITVDYATADATASAAGGDYTAASGTLTFAPGQTVQTVTVTIAGDTIDEHDETFYLNLSNATNATVSDNQGIGTIVDDDSSGSTPALSVDDVTVTEGNTGTVNVTFTVNLSTISGKIITVDYATADATASAAGGDYTAVSGTLTFAPGETSQTVTVTIAGDTIYEQHETFFLNLSNATNATLFNTQGIGTIVDDDSGSTPALSVDDVTVTEGNTGTVNVTFTVNLSTISGNIITVDYATADATASAAGGDYTAASGTLTFAPGQTVQTVTVTIAGDTIDEHDETFYLNLSNATNATLFNTQGVGTITDDDSPSSSSGGGGSSTGCFISIAAHESPLNYQGISLFVQALLLTSFPLLLFVFTRILQIKRRPVQRAIACGGERHE